MFIEERLNKILHNVMMKKRLTVKGASQLLHVSMDTVRRDFDKLAKRNMVQRTHGGIIALDTIVLKEFTFNERKEKYQAEKMRIAEEAAKLIKNNDIIILDSGTTTLEITKYLRNFEQLTILTNSLNVAVESVKYPQHTTIILGGNLRTGTLSIIGPDTVNFCKNYHADKLFLSVSAISIEKGVMNPNRIEAETKKGLIEIANEVIVVTDSTKINKTALYSFGSINVMSTLITDKNSEEDFIRAVEKLGISVIIA